MVLTDFEFDRVFEFVKWGVEKQNIQNPDFISAYQKLYELHNTKAERYIISVDQDHPANTTYSSLSDKAKLFIEKRIEEGKKNTYHSIMAILNDRFTRSIYVDKETFRQEYIDKYGILSEDYEAFNEVFDTAFSNFFRKNKK